MKALLTASAIAERGDIPEKDRFPHLWASQFYRQWNTPDPFTNMKPLLLPAGRGWRVMGVEMSMKDAASMLPPGNWAVLDTEPLSGSWGPREYTWVDFLPAPAKGIVPDPAPVRAKMYEYDLSQHWIVQEGPLQGRVVKQVGDSWRYETLEHALLVANQHQFGFAKPLTIVRFVVTYPVPKELPGGGTVQDLMHGPFYDAEEFGVAHDPETNPFLFDIAYYDRPLMGED